MAIDSSAAAAAALLLAFVIDHTLGEPPAALHPVVWMGRYLGRVGRFIAPATAQTLQALKPRNFLMTFTLGALTWCAGAAIVFIVPAVLQNYLLQLPAIAAALLLGLLLKPLLAWRMLYTEVQAVEAALAQSLAAGRARLALLVSRDTAALSQAQVREAAIESLAENLNDSVVAPVFWFCLAGLPGAALYRFANTADAMWGYRGERGGRDWTWAGKFAARADDVLSWLPARMTAVLLALVCLRVPPFKLLQEARKTPSPNSGWPMAAMALALGLRLGKPGAYDLNPQGIEPTAAHTAKALRLASQALLLMGACIAAWVVLGGPLWIAL